MSSSDEEKVEKEDVQILVSFEGHNRIGKVVMGSTEKDLRDMCEELYAEKDLGESEYSLKYFNNEWDSWVDVVAGKFVLAKRQMKLKIAGEGEESAHAVGGPSSSEGTNKTKLSSLMGKLMKTNKAHVKNSHEEEPGSSSVRGKKEEIQVMIGWQHSKTTDPPHYTQVRANNGGGVVPTKVRRTETSYDTLLLTAKEIFFPNGKSQSHGDANNLDFFLANYRGQSLYENFDLDNLFVCKSRARIYLMSKPKGSPSTSEGSPSSSSSSSLMDPFLNDFAAASEQLDSGTPTVSFRAPVLDAQHLKCVICSDRTKSNFFIPCGHCICMPCGTICMQDNKTCPFCKSTVEKMGSLF